MKNCKDIENDLPLYLDHLLSGADKQDVEEHLKSCPHCTKALAQLQKTGKMVNELPEVEPPPWFKQKIMARVREEGEKKSFVQKWFYPLRIKIPVQIFATVCIAVLAVYIYRAGEGPMREIVPSSVPAPVLEVPKDQLPEQTQRAPETVTANVTKEKAYAGKGTRDEKTLMSDRAPGAAPPKAEEQVKAQPRKNIQAGAVDAAKDIKEDAVSGIQADRYASAPAAKSAETSGVVLEKKKETNLMGASMKADRARLAQSLMPTANMALRVADIHAAVGEVETLLTKYGAKNIVRKAPEGKTILTAEFKVQNMKELVARLKAVGRIEERSIPVDQAAGNILIVIEIVNE